MTREPSVDDASAWFQSVMGNVFKPESSASAPERGASPEAGSTSEGLLGGMFQSQPTVPQARAVPAAAAATAAATPPPAAGTGDFWAWAASQGAAAADNLSKIAAETAAAASGAVGGSSVNTITGQAKPSRLAAAEDPLDALDVASLPVKDLRELIKRSGLSDANCVEKADLVARGYEAKARLRDAAALKRRTDLAKSSASMGRGKRTGAAAAAAAASVAARHEKGHPRRTLGELECLCVGERLLGADGSLLPESARLDGGDGDGGDGATVEPADYIIFCFHGYQATAASLATLVDVIRSSAVHGKGCGSGSSSSSSCRVVCVLPQSPGVGWWDINFAAYGLALALGETAKAKVLRDVPSGVPEARAQVAALVHEARTLYADPAAPTAPPASSSSSLSSLSLSSSSSSSSYMLPASRCFFLGFSQGAMLALDSALAMEEAVGGVILVSGFLMDVDTWGSRLAATHRNIRVLQVPFRTRQGVGFGRGVHTFFFSFVVSWSSTTVETAPA